MFDKDEGITYYSKKKAHPSTSTGIQQTSNHITLIRQHIKTTYGMCTEGKLNGPRNTNWLKTSNDYGINFENTAKKNSQEDVLASHKLDV